MLLVTRTGLRHGRRAAVATGLGVNAGLLGWTIASALGIGALLAASATAFTFMKLLGSSYLAWLGVRTLLDARKSGWGALESVLARETSQPALVAFRQGCVNNLLNPKAAAIYLTLFPQFTTPQDPLRPLVLAFAGRLGLEERWAPPRSVTLSLTANCSRICC